MPSSFSVPGAPTRRWYPPALLRWDGDLVPGRVPLIDPRYRPFWRDHERRWREIWRDIWRDLPLQLAIAHVGTDKTFIGDGNNANPTTVTLNQQPGAGNALFIAIAHFHVNWTNISSISGCGISSYAHLVQTNTNPASSSDWFELWAGFNASGAGGTSLSVTPGATGDIFGFTVAEFSGLDTGGALDGAAVINNGTNLAAATAGPITTANANDLLIGGGYQSGSGSWTLDGSSTNFGSASGTAYSASTTDQLLAAWRIVSSTGTYSSVWTLTSGTEDFCSGYVAVKAAGSGPAPTPFWFSA